MAGLGPGCYKVNDAIVKESSRKANFSKASKKMSQFDKAQGSNLGPGTYDVTEGSKGRVYTFGQKRETSPDNKVPGPGHYDASDEMLRGNARGHSFSKGERVVGGGMRSTSADLGPGYYDSQEEDTRQVYSFAKGGERHGYIQNQ